MGICPPAAPKSPYCFDNMAQPALPARTSTVARGTAIMFTADGLAPPREIPILRWFGSPIPDQQGVWLPFRDTYNNPVALRASVTQVTIVVPGSYKLDTSAIPAQTFPQVRVMCETVSADELELMCCLRAQCKPPIYTALIGWVMPNTNEQVFLQQVCREDGSYAETAGYFNSQGTFMPNISGFQPGSSDTTQSRAIIRTAANGTVDDLVEHARYINGVMQAPYYTRPNSLVAVVPAATDKLGAAAFPIRFRTTQTITVTGVAGVALPAITAVTNLEGNSFPTHGNIFVQADGDATAGAGIMFTMDGSVPTDTNGEQAGAGTRIVLQSYANITGFRAVPINNLGEIDGTKTVTLHEELWNIDPGTPEGVA